MRIHAAISGLLVLTSLGCGPDVPAELRDAVDSQRAEALDIALAAAEVCPRAIEAAPFQKSPISAGPLPANPALHTKLADDDRVVDVLVECSWPDPRHPDGSTWGGTSLRRLRGPSKPPLRMVTMPEDFAENNCDDDEARCEQLIVPSRHVPNERSADLRIVRPTSDGGRAELVVVFAVAAPS
jgi:hypothetical protein